MNLKEFKILTIWESDFYKDKDNVINKCINFIKNE